MIHHVRTHSFIFVFFFFFCVSLSLYLVSSTPSIVVFMSSWFFFLLCSCYSASPIFCLFSSTDCSPVYRTYFWQVMLTLPWVLLLSPLPWCSDITSEIRLLDPVVRWRWNMLLLYFYLNDDPSLCFHWEEHKKLGILECIWPVSGLILAEPRTLTLEGAAFFQQEGSCCHYSQPCQDQRSQLKIFLIWLEGLLCFPKQMI